MNAEAQTVWLHAAVDALSGIRAEEVAHVSAEVRRSVTRHNQIVPEISKLVAERRSKSQRDREFTHAHLPAPPIKKDVMDRRGQAMSEEDTAELNKRLEHLGASARYRADGSRYLIR
jgi:hypothetical protein